ncbi:MAG: DUF87 domain-containing protein [Lachnospiraceae bacterium]|nr:DUF87 domain-containing protein [Lachnospiraceae bacterium]
MYDVSNEQNNTFSYKNLEAKWMEARKHVEYELKLAQGFHAADVFLNQNYLDNFQYSHVKEISGKDLDISKIRMFEISKIVYDSDEESIDKLNSVYSALYNIGSSVAIYIVGNSIKARFFLAVRCDCATTLAADMLEAALRGNFPGIKLIRQGKEEKEKIIAMVENCVKNKSLATVSIVPSYRAQDITAENYVQGLEKFVDTMSNKEYVVILLATPVNKESLEQRRHGYEELYSTLSPHSKISFNYGQNESYNVSKSISDNFSETIGESISNTNGTSESWGNGSNWGNNFGVNVNLDNWGMNSGTSNGGFSSYTTGTSFARTVSQSTSSTQGYSDTKTRGETVGGNNAITITHENKGVQILLEKIEKQLKRMAAGESFGMWECGCYFAAEDIAVTALAANSFKALMSGEDSNVESSHLSIWNNEREKEIQKILLSVEYMKHPVAEIKIDNNIPFQSVTPTNLISGAELPVILGLPRKSVSGVAVVDMAEFGRSVVYENKIPEKPISFGHIYHMGNVEKNEVPIDINLLSSHCFITGSSGSGKSYATYKLLNSLLEQNIKMMVIEPAKGEYKQVFGGLRGIKIYTTDPQLYRLLRINPFQFPDNIHVLSHVDQLLQIFNASWPLYAAMPAILKEAVVNAYVKCGWDLNHSVWIKELSKKKYPTFTDVLEELPKIINRSEFSADSKGDYKGALVTRVQAMTTGINGLIFEREFGISYKMMFDSNAIIDLSDVGSDETRALIMGMLIMQLGEYRKSVRKSQGGKIHDESLSHVTVLEEAHNLLKRVPKEQSQDSSNMVGQSVEMISNSIKEMRTYGEGFIIIDQSPMAVDESVIENTSTKMVLNIPSKDASKEMGSALALNEKQTMELSRLNVGVAAIMQKGWLQPVLMKVDYWENKYEAEIQVSQDMLLKEVRTSLVIELYRQLEHDSVQPMRFRQIINRSALWDEKKRELIEVLDMYMNDSKTNIKEAAGELILNLSECRAVFEVIPKDNILTMREYVSQRMTLSENDKRRLAEQLQFWVKKWISDFYVVFDYYLNIDNLEDKNKILKSLLKTTGNGGYDDRNIFATIYQIILCWEENEDEMGTF